MATDTGFVYEPFRDLSMLSADWGKDNRFIFVKTRQLLSNLLVKGDTNGMSMEDIYIVVVKHALISHDTINKAHDFVAVWLERYLEITGDTEGMGIMRKMYINDNTCVRALSKMAIIQRPIDILYYAGKPKENLFRKSMDTKTLFNAYMYVLQEVSKYCEAHGHFLTYAVATKFLPDTQTLNKAILWLEKSDKLTFDENRDAFIVRNLLKGM